MAIQIAKHLGARVATTVSRNNFDFVKGLGADTAIDYGGQDFAEVVRDLDAVFDTVGGDTCLRSYRVLKKGGRIVSLLGMPSKELAREFGVEAIEQRTQVTTERLNILTSLVDRRALKVHVGEAFSPERAAEALLRMERGALRGKVILRIGSV